MTVLDTSPEAAAADRELDPRDPLGRLAQLCDPGTLVLLRGDDSGVSVARGLVAGQRIIAYCNHYLWLRIESE